jgi:hypothetical protein
VFAKSSESLCTTTWVHGDVTGGVHTAASIKFDGLPRHMSDVRLEIPENSFTNHNDLLSSSEYGRR